MAWTLATLPWAIVIGRLFMWNGSWTRTIVLATVYTLIVAVGTAAALTAEERRARHESR